MKSLKQTIQTQENSIKIYNASAGSGKTFTLVKEYLKVLLSNTDPYKFQEILALTFTNKATSEMKVRIIESLCLFSKCDETSMFTMIQDELTIPKKILFERSKKVLSAILQRYSAFKVTTIDSFNHQIIRAFSYDLGISLTAGIELDAKSLLDEAVDLLIADIGDDKELTTTLISYAVSKLNQDKSWDVSLTLKKRAEIILNENDAAYLKKIRQLPLSELRKISEDLKKKNKAIEHQFEQIGTQGIKLIASKKLNHNDFSYSELPKFFIKLTDIAKLKYDDLKFDGRLHKNITANTSLHPKRLSEDVIENIKEIEHALKEHYHKAHQLYIQEYGNYLLNHLVMEHLVPLTVIQYVQKYLQKIKKDQNLILNAEFNSIIGNSINSQPAPFIYERIGEKFSHFFIDEMQDTSQLQWQNLSPLIENTLATTSSSQQGNSLLMVGDAKQSIYRWRGGNAGQFIRLSDPSQKVFNLVKEVRNLETNYRSFSEIINFNNHFFTYLSSFFGNKEYEELFLSGNNQQVNSQQGGYVQLSFLAKADSKEEQELKFPEEVYKTIQSLDKNYKKSEVCILVRTQKNGVAVANYLNEQGIEVISSETLLIANNPKVQFIINSLKAVQNPKDLNAKIQMLYFLHTHLEVEEPTHDFHQRMLKINGANFFDDLKGFGIFFRIQDFLKKHLYDGITYLIKSFQIIDIETDAYVQFFLDEVIEFERKQPATLFEFLEFWEQKKQKLSIVSPENENAVRIMTIHKAKGLEFPVVIYPYNTSIYKQIDPTVWYETDVVPDSNYVLLPFGKQLNYLDAQGIQLFEEQRQELELDSFNVLYVALTRAVEQLYVITEEVDLSKLKEYNTTASVFAKYLEEKGLWNENDATYSFGNPNKPFYKKLINEVGFKTQQSFINNLNNDLFSNMLTREAMLWETEQEAALSFGNLVHEIMLKIRTKNDVKKVLDASLFSGKINELTYTKLEKLIESVVAHPKISHLFNNEHLVLNERKLVNQQQEILIPDRVVFVNNLANIIDYKTGKPDKKHQTQVNQYAHALEQMGHIVDMKVLIYLKEELEVLLF